MALPVFNSIGIDNDFEEIMAELYETIYTRRDVRSEFVKKSVPDSILARVLCAAHHAPSVGLSQPWRFLVIDDQETKKNAHALFEEANAQAVELFSQEKRTLYSSLKLEGILDAPLNICITCDRRKRQPILGSTHQLDTDLYSTACAVQNFWLAAKAEQLGVGWVSVMNENAISQLLGLPDNVVPVAYLCLGYVSQFQETPDLIRAGWSKREPLSSVVYKNKWLAAVETDLREELNAALEHRDGILSQRLPSL